MRLPRPGCGSSADRPQVKWCEFGFGNNTIPNNAVTLLHLGGFPPGLTVSDPAYFTKASTLAFGIGILQKGIYKLSLHTSIIAQPGVRGTVQMLWPHFLNPVAALNRFNTDSPNVGINAGGLAEMAYDNTFEGWANFPNPTPGSGYGFYSELRVGYTFDFRVGDGLALQDHTEVNFYYHQNSGAAQNLSTFSQGTILYYPSDVEDHPPGYGTTYSYP
jgi:hypothetical protein